MTGCRLTSRKLAGFFVVPLLVAFLFTDTGQAAPSSNEVAQSENPSGLLDTRLSQSEQGNSIRIPQARSSRAKIRITLPTLYLRGNFIACNKSIAEPFTDPAGAKCPPELHEKLPQQYLQFPDRAIYGAVGGYYIAFRDGQKLIYGRLPSVRVRTLAFGSVPVEATVGLTQAVERGKVLPVSFAYAILANIGTAADEGAPSWPGFGPVPPVASNGEPPGLALRTEITGRFDVQISNVTVDGRPVETGKGCHTKTPATLSVDGPRGFYYLSALGRQRGTPPAFQPPASNDQGGPGYFDGNLEIPSFVGCEAPSENLDALLTALVSSKDNHVSGFIPDSFVYAPWCDQPIAQCAQLKSSRGARSINIAAVGSTDD